MKILTHYLNIRCAKCSQYVEGEVVSALGNTFHQKCFTCARYVKCVNSYTTTPVVYNDDLYTSIKEANVVV